jgi:processive 1,2-diacylglycerol beta-glucosyltransferase
MSRQPRILIVTAAFGEGHNSAARNLGLALEEKGAQARVGDPCLLGAPGITALLSRGYRMVTTRFPRLWARIYKSTDRCDFSRRTSPVMRLPERALGALIDEFRPEAIVSTYPLYPYFLRRIPQGIGRKIPVFTVVTDSIEINAAWLRAPSDWWLVTDAATREAMAGRGLPAERIIDTGFAVHPVFSRTETVPENDACEPFRVLYFPTAQRSLLRSHGRAVLEAAPQVRLTLVLGRNVRRLHAAARELKQAHPGRVRIIGWTRRVPHLLSQHHLVVGKAGGATVHEAIAARCPMLIHHLVPGQEEGNLRLLEAIGGGGLAADPHELKQRIAALLHDRSSGWRGMKQALARHDRDSGALTAADFILGRISNPEIPI